MRGKLALGVSLLLAAATSFAGSAAGQFAVQITLNNPSITAGSSNSCTSATGSGVGSSSVQVTCTTNVFVDIAQVNTSQANTLGAAKFMPSFRPTRDTLLPDYCRNELSRANQAAGITCRLDAELEDAQRQFAYGGDEAGDGWKLESRLYAVDTNATAAQTQARLRLQDDRGTLTALRVAHAGGLSGSVEMLVSF
ncbi:hypothetical protein [Polaromonas sp.]|uniref:hypothetical protein n=1 Tax=Polaromonas sp. TaxID=1869339 RepID=UPI002FCB5218